MLAVVPLYQVEEEVVEEIEEEKKEEEKDEGEDEEKEEELVLLADGLPFLRSC